ncbi:N-lysine methyltransferase KMT5A-A [Diachasma alloeum]|uniref:N-lysine methyltransferase KMT5A-A n=1 Tax=Diachasma alloeum TaxID=454923 RepID=UPI000738248A|nr:N-lysine methyltransferase KMT5A-A [Diachasma alloeum]
MVKGRRKRTTAPSSIHTRSTALNGANGAITSPLRKGIKLEKKIDGKMREVSPGTRGIASYLSPPPSGIVNGERTKIVEHVTTCIITENELYRTDIQVKNESAEFEAISPIRPMKELFKTDETPVHVPCEDPPTPHRINMPDVQNDDSDTRSSTEDDKKHLIVSPPLAKPVGRKPTGRGRGKLKANGGNQRLTDLNITSPNHKVTEYFPVRRSVRKCKKTVLEEKQRDLESKVIRQVEEGLEKKYFVGKGRGVVTTREFNKGEFVVEYVGELIDQVTAKKREAEYAKDQSTGCYMYYFQHRGHQYCVDATAESDKLGRLVNHSRNGNLIARVVEVDTIPHLVLTAKEDIPIGIELTYDYGDRSRESIRNHPWLAL